MTDTSESSGHRRRRGPGALRRASLAAVFLTIALAGVGQGAASADVTAVGGSAFGYYSSVAFNFGGGPGPPSVDGPAPSVTLPSTGGTESLTVPYGIANAGPAVFFEGGPITASTAGVSGPGGYSTASTSSTAVDQTGWDPFHYQTVESSCSSSEAGTTASASMTGFLYLGNALVVELPPVVKPGTEYFGSIDGVGDTFRIVLNEQVVTSDSITVNAMHLYLTGPFAFGEVIVGQAHCEVAATSANQAPVGGDDGYTMDANTQLTVPGPGVLANDTDGDADPLTAQMPAAAVSSYPANGDLTFNSDGSFVYAPDADFGGDDTFTYLVRDPRGGSDTATVTITVAPPTGVTNDDFADARVISGFSGLVRSGDNVDATFEAGEPPHGGYAENRSIWYRWTAPATGDATFDTCGSSQGFVVGVYTGDSVDALTSVVNESGGCGGAGVAKIRATAGTVYHIALAQPNGASSGTSTLTWSLVAAPDNDQFANAEVLSGPSGEAFGNNAGASLDEGHFAEKSVWYKWTAPQDGVVAFDNCNTNISDEYGNPTSGYYYGFVTGDSAATLTDITYQDNSGAYGILPDCATPHYTSVFRTTAGTDYYIFFGSLPQEAGVVFLTWQMLPQAPNDDFVDAQGISGPSGSVTGSNGPASVATSEQGEPTHAFNDPFYAIWYRWTAPSTGEVSFDTCDSPIDTILAVYTGSAVEALTEVSANDDGCETGAASKVTFNAIAGTTYQIATGSNYLGQVGTVVLAWTQTVANQPPVAVNDAYTTTAGTPLTVAAPGVLNNDTDPDGNTLTAGSASDPAGGTVTLNGDGSFTYTPEPGFTGADTFTYTADDGNGGTAVATVTVTTSAPPVEEPECRAVQATIVGTAGHDYLVGTSGRDVILGFGGNDRILGLGGDDLICGGSGDDRLVGGDGNDTILGGDGNDDMRGDAGNDTLKGGGGDDLIRGGAGDDELNGKDGTDLCRAGAGRDRLFNCETTA